MLSSPSSSATRTSFKIGVDIGGTFTDLVFLLPNGEMRKLKVPSSPHDYSEAIVSGIRQFCDEQQLDAREVQEVVHATTVATNAILERKGARTALITTQGFRDVLELRRIRIPASYDSFWVKPVPLVDRCFRYELAERMLADGQVAQPLHPSAVHALAARLREETFEAVAVSLLHAYRNPEHEALIGRVLSEALPGVSLSLSHQVLPEMLEFERTSTTVVNAYVMPLIDRYLQTLRSRLDALEVRAPILVMQSNGGLISSNAARRRPVSIIESGPAAGVVAAQRVAAECGYENVLTLDMGGTTTKASIIEKGVLLRATEYEVGSAVSVSSRLMRGNGYVLRIPVIDISEVGAGGGSIATIDAGGALRVGPQSAGAHPGPACYGLGNDRTTVTDANLVLGYLAEGSLAGGAVAIDSARSRAAIEQDICAGSGLSLMEAAYGIHLVATSNMVRAIKTVSVERGRDPAEFVLMVFGGAGPIHAALVARELGISTVVVPPAPGVFSAFGLLRADIEQHASRTVLAKYEGASHAAELEQDMSTRAQPVPGHCGGAAPSDGLERSTPASGRSSGGLRAVMQEMSQELRHGLIEEGCDADRIDVLYFADVRYSGQSSEITLPLPLQPDGSVDFPLLERRFEQEFERAYGYLDAVKDYELVTLRSIATVRRDLETGARWSAHDDGGAASDGLRECYFGEGHGMVKVPVVTRGSLQGPGRAGPLIVQEYDTNVVVPPGCSAVLDERGNIIIAVEA